MRYKINVLEERLISIASFDSHVKEHPVHQRLESHLQINADAFCDELTANLIKLEKVTLYDMMQMLVALIRFFLNSYGLFF